MILYKEVPQNYLFEEKKSNFTEIMDIHFTEEKSMFTILTQTVRYINLITINDIDVDVI